MRISLVVSFMLLFFLTVATYSQTHEVRLHVKNPVSNQIALGYHYGDKQYIFDTENGEGTTTLDESGFGVLVANEMKPGIYLLLFGPDQHIVEFIFEGKDLDVYVDGLSLTEDDDNSISNRLFAEELNYRKSIHALEKENENGAGKALELLTLIEQFKVTRVLNKAKYPDNMFVNILETTDVPVVPETNKQEAWYYFRDHFFDNVDFNAEWIIRSPILEEKLKTYFEELTHKDPDSIIKSLDRVASLAEANKEVYNYILTRQLNTVAKSKIMGHDKVYVHIVKKYYATGKTKANNEKNLRLILADATSLDRFLIGKIAPDFSMEHTSGNHFRLHEIDSKYIFLIFTDLDCKHCKSYEKRIVELKDEFPSELKIVSVELSTLFPLGFEKRMSEYKKEIDYFWDYTLPASNSPADVRYLYNIRASPKMFLLDAKKKIIAKSLTADQVVDFIKIYEESLSD